MNIKAITVSQPFADLISSGAKFVENRTWETSHRGPLAIHAGKGTQYITAKELRGYVTGAVVATCELITCVNVASPSKTSVAELERNGMTLAEVLNHEHCEGPVAWVLFEVRKCPEPFPILGKQGLWNLETANIESFAY